MMIYVHAKMIIVDDEVICDPAVSKLHAQRVDALHSLLDHTVPALRIPLPMHIIHCIATQLCGGASKC